MWYRIHQLRTGIFMHFKLNSGSFKDCDQNLQKVPRQHCMYASA